MPRGKLFSPRDQFLEAKVVGNGSQWDQDRMLQPERAFPCLGKQTVHKGAADFHDKNEEREKRPAWKPTIANRVSGMGVQVEAAFPMLPPIAKVVRPDGAARRPRGRPA